MMGQGFDPASGSPMGRMGTYGGFPGAPTPPFSGILSSFPPVGGGVAWSAPHVNPVFGRGMPMNGMGMMPTSGVDGPNMGMWSDPSMGGWGGEEHCGGELASLVYGEEAASDHQYGEVSHDRGGWQNTIKEKDKASEREWFGSSDRRYRDDREAGYDRDMLEKKIRVVMIMTGREEGIVMKGMLVTVVASLGIGGDPRFDEHNILVSKLTGRTTRCLRL
ncbi:hypothetical protein GH714_006772 [Hevea brasiliensis]|uniref:Uncharacterized protein n=1 Tax=Hevea brasiliensis TaxID=3981 RepID=A0A6A6LZL7_HEVBR|nr:hypothetical protein GH714_006772 [Hevea brasiliensis]